MLVLNSPVVSSDADNNTELSGENCVAYTGPLWPCRETLSQDTVSSFGVHGRKSRYTKQNYIWKMDLIIRKLLYFINRKESDKNPVSTNSICPESNIKVMRMKEMIEKSRYFWLLDKFSLYVTWEMYKEQYGEYASWR